jgi:transcriptional regulator with XRE-family HTH domain
MHERMGAPTTGTRLQQARLAAGLQLSDIEQRTRISPSVLRWIDAGQFQRLPAGIYARSYIRAFAEAVGLDPHEFLASIDHELPVAADITAAPVVRTSERTTTHSPELSRMAAASADAALLSVIYALVLGATAAVCRLPVSEVLAFGMPATVLVLIVLTGLYFLLFAGVQGRTPGAALVGLPALEGSGPIQLNAIAARAMRAFISEASLGIEIASRRPRSRDVSTAAPYGSRSTP